MHAISLTLGASIRWKISRAAPLILDLELGPGNIVNPLLCNTDIMTVITDDDFIIFDSNTIIVTLNKVAYADYDYNDPVFRGQLSRFLSWLRSLAFLFRFKSTADLVAVTQVVDLPTEMPRMPAQDELAKGMGYILEYYLTNYVDHDIARVALEKANSGESVPIHRSLLIDAYAAFQNNDYRTCLLYAAIAAESLAAGRLEQEYTTRVAGGDGPAIRLIDLPLAGGKSVRKDPVYDALAAKTDFGFLIHERPLYLLGRSLLIDQPETYRLAKKLYSTRNKIVHRGELSEDDDDKKMFDTTRVDSIIALRCVANIFTWFNESAIKYPSDKLVPFNQEQIHRLWR